MGSARRGAPVRLVEGPITPALLTLAGPVFLSRALHTLYGVVDTAWVGRLGPEALAAVSTCFFASWMILAGGSLFITGTTALVSQAVGARDDDTAANAALTGMVLAAVVGTVVAVVGWFGSGILFRLVFDDEEVIRLGISYLSIYALATP
ncbi:MAG: hypothetical protein HKN12_10795, partial [Gemmatimonadetes bacterium]|nr:hypothetical protein [Gemmatimonadota bacterium]